VAGIVLHRPHLGRGAERVGDALGRALVIRGEGDAHVAVVEDGVVLPVGLLDLVQRLGDQEGLQPIARHEGELALEEVEPPKRRELVEHQQQTMPTSFRFELLGQTASDLVEHEAHQRLGARDVRGRHNEIERHRALARNEVVDAPVAATRDPGDHGITIKPEETHRGREHARAFVLGFVQQLASRLRNDGVRPVAQMRGTHHRRERRLDWALRVGEKRRDTGERLVDLGVEDMEDRADQQRMAGLLPMVPAFELALGVDEDVGDVLDVAHFAVAAPDLQQRIVGRACRVGGVEQQDTREARTPAGGELPVLALDVVHDRGARPGKERGDDEAIALAGTGRRETEHMLRAVMAEIALLVAPEHHAVLAQKARSFHILAARPAGRAIGCHVARFAGAQHREKDRDGDGRNAARSGDDCALDKDARRIGVVPVPPDEDVPGRVDRPAEEQRDARHDDDLSPEDLGGRRLVRIRTHGPTRPCRRSPAQGRCDTRRRKTGTFARVTASPTGEGYVRPLNSNSGRRWRIPNRP